MFNNGSERCLTPHIIPQELPGIIPGYRAKRKSQTTKHMAPLVLPISLLHPLKKKINNDFFGLIGQAKYFWCFNFIM